MISENPLSQFQLPFRYLEHRNHCQHHSIDSVYLNILWGFLFGWVLFCFGVDFFGLFFTGKNTLKYWCLDDEPSLPIWFAMLPVLNSCTENWLEFIRRVLRFSGWGRAGLTCPSSDICTFLRFTTLPLFTTAYCGNSCCSNVPGLSACVSRTLNIVYFKCSPGQIQWCTTLWPLPMCSMTWPCGLYQVHFCWCGKFTCYSKAEVQNCSTASRINPISFCTSHCSISSSKLASKGLS